MRCLALADALRELGANCTFISREHRGNLVDQIAKSGYNLICEIDIGVPFTFSLGVLNSRL